MVDVPSRRLRQALVDHLRRQRLIHDPRVAQAFLAVPREAFLPDELAREGLAAVYRDDAIVTRRDPQTRMPLSSSSQPAIMALMLEMLDVRPGDRVVEIGAGTGYNAALLDLLTGPDGLVVTIDIDTQIVLDAAAALRVVGSRVHAVVGDGALGLPGAVTAGAPVDRIEVTASTAVLPRGWYDQLKPGGKLVVPLRLSNEIERAHAVTAFEKVPGGFDALAVTPGGFMPLRRVGGSTFDPTGRSLAPGQPPGPSLAGAGRSPLTRVGRHEMDRLAIAVRYSVEPPATRWRFDRGDHWIGVDLKRT